MMLFQSRFISATTTIVSSLISKRHINLWNKPWVRVKLRKRARLQKERRIQNAKVHIGLQGNGNEAAVRLFSILKYSQGGIDGMDGLLNLYSDPDVPEVKEDVDKLINEPNLSLANTWKAAEALSWLGGCPPCPQEAADNIVRHAHIHLPACKNSWSSFCLLVKGMSVLWPAHRDVAWFEEASQYVDSFIDDLTSMQITALIEGFSTAALSDRSSKTFSPLLSSLFDIVNKDIANFSTEYVTSILRCMVELEVDNEKLFKNIESSVKLRANRFHASNSVDLLCILPRTDFSVSQIFSAHSNELLQSKGLHSLKIEKLSELAVTIASVRFRDYPLLDDIRKTATAKNKNLSASDAVDLIYAFASSGFTVGNELMNPLLDHDAFHALDATHRDRLCWAVAARSVAGEMLGNESLLNLLREHIRCASDCEHLCKEAATVLHPDISVGPLKWTFFYENCDGNDVLLKRVESVLIDMGVSHKKLGNALLCDPNNTGRLCAVIDIDTPDHYHINKPHLRKITGAASFRRAILRKSNMAPVSLPHWDWRALNTDDNYLRDYLSFRFNKLSSN